jgi:hypothetical protein
MTRLSTNRRSLLHRPWLVWLAVWLALFAALAPTVSYAFHAAASRDAADLHAVCSSAYVASTPHVAPTAPEWLQAKAPQSDDSDAPLSTDTGSHCQRCLLSIERLVILISGDIGFAIQPETYAQPVAPSPQFLKSFLELNPPPRGPPALS